MTQFQYQNGTENRIKSVPVKLMILKNCIMRNFRDFKPSPDQIWYHIKKFNNRINISINNF